MAPESAPAVGQVSGPGNIHLTSEEINILIYLYLLESNFKHTAFTLLSESALPSTSLFQQFNPGYPTPPSQRAASSLSGNNSRTNGVTRASGSELFGAPHGKVPRGELVRKLWKALRWEEIERHTATETESSAPPCHSPFQLLVPHICSPEGATPAPAVSSPPPQRPDTFPTQQCHDAAQGDLGGNSPTTARDMDVMSPLAIGKGKRKSAETNTPSVEGGVATPASKRIRDDDRRKSKTDDTKDIRPVSRVAKPSGIAGLPASEGNSWTEHRDAVTCLAWNPKDKEVLVTGSNDGTARRWHFMEASDPSSHALQLQQKPTSISHKAIDSSKKAVTALAWHPDGTVFVTASDGVGRLFTPSGQLQGILSYGRGTINSLKFNPSGNSLLAAKDDFTVCLFLLNFDLQSPKQLSFESHSKEVNDVDWLDDDVFASGGNDHTIFIYRSNDRRPRFTLKGHSDDVTRVKWSPPRRAEGDQQRLLASVSDDGTIMIWKLPHYPADRGTASRSLSPSKQPREKESSVDDFFQMTVLQGNEYCVNRLQVVSSNTENKRMSTVEWGPSCRDGRMIIAACAPTFAVADNSGGQDSTVKLFDASTGECLHTLLGLEHGTGSIAFSPSTSLARPGGVLAGGGWNGKAILWDVETGEVLKQYEIEEDVERQSTRDRPMMMAMAWRHDGQQLAVGLHNKSLMTAYVGPLL
ncbi:WD40 repeat-like protein [Cutaneotrichosporon oleaginosum]|uniref:WD40 repeat-like protein n=1 Tax=Cutaneotrichosporon oleaginosum TaxID=879819 RepID=A0A0J0XG08_9TREE|nr:WD40 repeat-like protein [Cutaneotrichosporon oleaginosum]KLT40000.1 WD40 repeat-like protein [Cutaneotrichosporon oleaginosum]TXT14190.1 hypothetical protein COLE_00383 [Cutaneotrichosporon oleaginosum]